MTGWLGWQGISRNCCSVCIGSFFQQYCALLKLAGLRADFSYKLRQGKCFSKCNLENVILLAAHRMHDQNPYSAPSFGDQPLLNAANGAFLTQLKVLCILMIVLGFFELIMAVFYCALAFYLPAELANSNAGLPGNGGGPLNMEIIFTIVYGVGAALALVAGVLRIVAGIQGLRLRSWRLGVASHLLGLMNLLTCYCAPTSIAIAVWGLVVYLQPGVKEAFRSASGGDRLPDGSSVNRQ